MGTRGTRGRFNREGRITRPAPAPLDDLTNLSDQLRQLARHYRTTAATCGTSTVQIRAEAKAEAYEYMLAQVEDLRFS